MDTILFMTPIPHESCSRPLDGIRRYAHERGWHVQVIEEVKKSTPFREIIDLWRPIGIVAACGARFPEPIDKLFGRVPFVALDRDPDPDGVFRCPTVTQDSAATGREAAKELLSLGLSHYAYAGNSVPREWDDARRKAFVAALRVHRFGCHFFPGAGKGLAQYPLHLAKWLPTLPRPIGIFCANDWVADRVSGVCNRMDIRIPQEIALVGVDDDEHICNHTNPPLTSVSPDFEGSGYLAAEMLDRIVSSPGCNPEVARYSPVMTVRRASTACVGCEDESVAGALRLIRSHATETIDVDDVVAAMRCSRRLAQMRFKSTVGKTIHDAILDERMECVYRLLRQAKCNISAIASFSGFGTDANLRHAFHKRTGMSLSAWRKLHRMVPPASS